MKKKSDNNERQQQPKKQNDDNGDIQAQTTELILDLVETINQREEREHEKQTQHKCKNITSGSRCEQRQEMKATGIITDKWEAEDTTSLSQHCDHTRKHEQQRTSPRILNDAQVLALTSHNPYELHQDDFRTSTKNIKDERSTLKGEQDLDFLSAASSSSSIDIVDQQQQQQHCSTNDIKPGAFKVLGIDHPRRRQQRQRQQRHTLSRSILLNGGDDDLENPSSLLDNLAEISNSSMDYDCDCGGGGGGSKTCDVSTQNTEDETTSGHDNDAIITTTVHALTDEEVMYETRHKILQTVPMGHAVVVVPENDEPAKGGQRHDNDNNEIENRRRQRRQRRRMIILVVVSLLVICVAVGVIIPIVRHINKTNDSDDNNDIANELKLYLGSKSPMVFHDPDAQYATNCPHLNTINWLSTFYTEIPTTTDGRDLLWERYVLGVLYYSTNGDTWRNNTNWLSKTIPPCQWQFTGVPPGTSHCIDGQRLRGISLPGNGLDGEIPTVLGLLPYLKNINLSSNKFKSTIPEELSQVTSLESLVLFVNELSGPLPTALANMTNLQFVDVGNNQLTGTLPAEYSAWTNIETFRVTANHLSGTIPEAYSSWKTINTKLSLGFNQNPSITGEFPEALCQRVPANKTETDSFSVDCKHVTCSCCQFC